MPSYQTLLLSLDPRSDQFHLTTLAGQTTLVPCSLAGMKQLRRLLGAKEPKQQPVVLTKPEKREELAVLMEQFEQKKQEKATQELMEAF